MKIKGIKRGIMIELFEEIDIPDGMEVMVEIQNSHPLAGLSKEEIQKRINKVAGVWKDDPEIEQIFAEINQEPLEIERSATTISQRMKQFAQDGIDLDAKEGLTQLRE